jgi:hypothetical protein
MKKWFYKITNWLLELYIRVLVSVNIIIILWMAVMFLILIGGLL